jgi:hypothetical protein
VQLPCSAAAGSNASGSATIDVSLTSGSALAPAIAPFAAATRTIASILRIT